MLKNLEQNFTKQFLTFLKENSYIVKSRRLIETVIGQLVGRFHLEKVCARDIWHLSTRLNRKPLAHTVCFWLNLHILILYNLSNCSTHGE